MVQIFASGNHNYIPNLERKLDKALQLMNPNVSENIFDPKTRLIEYASSSESEGELDAVVGIQPHQTNATRKYNVRDYSKFRELSAKQVEKYANDI